LAYKAGSTTVVCEHSVYEIFPLLCSLNNNISVFADISRYAYSQVRYLSLPISEIFALFSVLLPIVTGSLILAARRILRSQRANILRSCPILYLILILGFQLIYETVIGTLALTYMVPPSSLNCGLENQWMHLWRTKNGAAIRRIQDRYECCGFNSVVDRAWPFPVGGNTPHTCEIRFERTRSCAGPWRQAEQVNAGIFLIVAAVIFVTKVRNLVQFRSAFSISISIQTISHKHLFHPVLTNP
jgi:hypothetical protein